MNTVLNIKDLKHNSDYKWCSSCSGRGVILMWPGFIGKSVNKWADEKTCPFCNGTGFCESYRNYLEKLITE